MAFAELWEEGFGEEWDRADDQKAGNGDGADDPEGMARDRGENFFVGRFQEVLKGRFVLAADAMAEEYQRQGGSQSEGDDQGREDGDDVRPPQRREELTLEAGEGEDGDEDEDDDEGGVDDGAADFDGGVEEHAEF